MVSPCDLLEQLINGGNIFGRGLPQDGQLQLPPVAEVLGEVLCAGVITKANFKSEAHQDVLRQCYHNGWLHADKPHDVAQPEVVGYVFPSLLHRWFIKWKIFN